MNYDMQQSGKRIHRLRVQNGLTQEGIAVVLNIDRSFYSRIEAGQKGCSVDLLVQISDLFHVSLDYLVLGRYPGVASNDLDVAQLKDEINQLTAHMERFKTTLEWMCPADTNVSNTL